jgi:hypothetical protein
MGEAKRRRRPAIEPSIRTWAKGALIIEAGGKRGFEWNGTRQDAVNLQKRYLDIVNQMPISAQSYAERVAGYLMVYGMPQVGDPDLRPSNFGAPWSADEIELNKIAILWSALHEHVPNTGLKLEDVFVGKQMLVRFEGDATAILQDTARELNGQPLSGKARGSMMAAVLDEDYKLDPSDAISMRGADLWAMLGRESAPEKLSDELFYLPRIPLDADEAKAMMQMLTVCADLTNEEKRIVGTYAGYTDDELRRGRPAVFVR